MNSDKMYFIDEQNRVRRRTRNRDAHEVIGNVGDMPQERREELLAKLRHDTVGVSCAKQKAIAIIEEYIQG